MSATWRHEHGLEPLEAVRRLTALAGAKGASTTVGADGLGGEVEQSTPFGKARARWRSLPGAIEIELLESPAFVPVGMIERALRDGLTRVLGTTDSGSP
jgi:hypothetical protein